MFKEMQMALEEMCKGHVADILKVGGDDETLSDRRSALAQDAEIELAFFPIDACYTVQLLCPEVGLAIEVVIDDGEESVFFPVNIMCGRVGEVIMGEGVIKLEEEPPAQKIAHVA